MQMMRAAVLESAPGPLRIEQIPLPEPLAVEVLVQRRRLDPELPRQRTDRESLQAVALEHFASGGHDLSLT